MSLLDAAPRILGQLACLVNDILPEDFSRQSERLGGSTIGQHLRHTVEFFTCFQAGCVDGVVNYDKRAHDAGIERDIAAARTSLIGIIAFVTGLRDNQKLQLEVCYNPAKELYETVDTSIMRELVYNIEHAIHHMAMIKIALREVAPYVEVDDNFGIAASTIRHGRVVNQVFQ